MNRALLYLYGTTLLNSLRQRLVRLRRPKYLFGAICGGLYFYLYFYRFLFLQRTMGGTHDMSGATPDVLGENIGSLFLFVAVLLLAWIIPAKRTALVFSDAEISMLFPAPLGRRELINYKLLTSQIPILFFAVFMTLITGRGATGRGWLHLGGWWVIITIFSLHRLGASFAITRLMERGMANWQRRLALLLGVAGIAAVLEAWRAMAPHPPGVEALADRGVISEYIDSLLLSGPGPWLLLPFRVVVRPYFATSVAEFFTALLPAFCLMILHYWWVMRADVSFEEASLAMSQKRAALIEARRKGDLRVSLSPRRANEPMFRLRSTGFSPTAFVWKAFLYSGGSRKLKWWFLSFAGALVISGAWMALRPPEWLPVALCITGGAVFLFIALANVSSGATYLRQDIDAMDLIQSYPIRGWQVVLGQLGAQAAFGTLLEWAALLVVTLGIFGLPESIRLSIRESMLVLASIAIMAPTLNLTMMIVPAGALLLWPGWFRTTPQSAGFEATGLRLILIFGQLMAVLIALVLPVIAGALVWWMLAKVELFLLWLPVAAAAASVVLALEAWAGIMMLGALFERFDITEE